MMKGTTFETGTKAAAGAVTQLMPVNTGEDLSVKSVLRLWGANTHGQLGIGTAGVAVPENNPVIIEGVKGLSIGNGSIMIAKEA